MELSVGTGRPFVLRIADTPARLPCNTVAYVYERDTGRFLELDVADDNHKVRLTYAEPLRLVLISAGGTNGDWRRVIDIEIVSELTIRMADSVESPK